MVRMAKLGRNICCLHRKNVQCVRPFRAFQHCFFFGNHVRVGERCNFDVGVCPFVPEAIKALFFANLEKNGFLEIGVESNV